VRLLLDTHAFLWWLDGDRRLSVNARRAIANDSNAILVSAVSAWEITTKARLGKLPGATDVAADVAACVAGQGFLSLDITLLHAQRAGRLPEPTGIPSIGCSSRNSSRTSRSSATTKPSMHSTCGGSGSRRSVVNCYPGGFQFRSRAIRLPVLPARPS
jgi:PIN domain nuclease of toxin-antitoxin system